jgi:hypothetical protein
MKRAGSKMDARGRTGERRVTGVECERERKAADIRSPTWWRREGRRMMSAE